MIHYLQLFVDCNIIPNSIRINMRKIKNLDTNFEIAHFSHRMIVKPTFMLELFFD